ncbi:MAG: ATP synthase subunit I [Mariprofundus sp.]|nr:ATP synthase subunit I [Mariprofundus sp.]
MTLGQTSAVTTIIRWQIISGVAGFFIMAVGGKSYLGLAFACGVALMVINGWWLARRMEKVRDLGVEAGQRSLYAGAALRFVGLIAGLLLAQLAGLNLLAVASGMFVAQAAVFFSALHGIRDEKNRSG